MKHLKCKICGFEAGHYDNGICIECQNRLSYIKETQPTIEMSFIDKIIEFEKNNKKQPIQMELWTN